LNSIKIHNSPSAYPVGKILCLGHNYADHVREMKAETPQNPVVFLKPSTAIIDDAQAICIPRFSTQPHHEVELVVVIGKDGKDIPRSAAFSHVLGYGVGLDMTLRDVQAQAKSKGLPWSVSKGFDTSAPVSSIVPSGTIPDPHMLTLRCSVNGIVRQEASTNSMIFRIDRIIEYISSVFTLETGDLIFTGTPQGVGTVQHGDLIEAELVGYVKTSHRVKFL